jgi:hypothetical protein
MPGFSQHAYRPVGKPQRIPAPILPSHGVCVRSQTKGGLMCEAEDTYMAEAIFKALDIASLKQSK